VITSYIFAYNLIDPADCDAGTRRILYSPPPEYPVACGSIAEIPPAGQQGAS
jgi:hypothetical protein